MKVPLSRSFSTERASSSKYGLLIRCDTKKYRSEMTGAWHASCSFCLLEAEICSVIAEETEELDGIQEDTSHGARNQQ